MANKYSSVYYPECYVGDARSLTTYLMIYDELHLIALSDDARNPTERFRNLPEYSHITSITASGTQEFSVSAKEIRSKNELDVRDINAKTRRSLLFHQFIQRYKSLIGEALFFHPHVLASYFNRSIDKMLQGGMTFEDFADIVTGKDKDLRAFREFQAAFPEIKDEMTWRIVPTAMGLAEKNDLILVSDDPDLPAPILSKNIPSVKMLTSILAEECVKVYVPRCHEADSSDILELRESLSEVLLPFRLSLQKLSADLRKALEAGADSKQIHQEAKFIAESHIEPAVFELKQSIEKSKSNFLNKVFGKVLSWIPFVTKAYAMPTPDNILGIAKKIGADSGALLDAADNVNLTQKQGLCFLLKVEEAMQK
ncbi:hypothetical protein [Prosthecobacter sp.]|uniref:hypothetical protein n=1 Tax=Prosthecobacter sp. TaxID=1965333 RepID=UPI003784A4A3